MKKNKPFGELFCRSLKKTLKIMRNALILLFIGVLQAHAIDTYSQKTRLSLNVSDAELSKVLDKIEVESEFFFLYNEKLLDTDRKVSITANDQLINVILDNLFAGTDVKYAIIDRKIILAPDYLTEVPQSQQVKVSGTITDASTGEPMPGVNVVIKGTNVGAITDAIGKYSLNVTDQNAVLVFSFIGYSTKEVPFAGKSVIDTILESEITGLDEVLVIGYGTMRKGDLTGAVNRADMEIFKESPNVNIVESLHGSIPGLNVGAVTSSGENPSLNIRGSTNFTGQNSPLIVLDGIIFRGNMNDINPNDVESVDVLKDASSASIYGSEASNGVILITSVKRGEKDKPSITYSTSYSNQVPVKCLNLLDAKGNIKMIEEGRWMVSRLPPDYITPNPAFDPVQYFKTEAYREGYHKYLSDGTETNWWDLLTGPAYVQDHNLSIRGNNYYLSGSFTDQNGFINNDNYKRYSFRINISSDITEWLNVGINSFVTSNDYSGASIGQEGNWLAFMESPFLSPYDEEGELIAFPDGTQINPLIISLINDLEKNNNLSAIIHSDIKLPFLKGFNYRLNYGNNSQINKHYQFDKWGFNLQGQSFKNYENYNNWTLDNIFTYEKIINQHKVNLTFVYGVEKREAEMTYSQAKKFITNILGYNALQQGSAPLNLLTSDAWEETSLYSMGRVIYSFKNKYLFTGTIRRDGFSGFGQDNKFGVFPSAAIGWVISQEEFMKDKLKWINFLKIRGSYGTTARRALERYQTLAKISSQGSYVFGQGGTTVIGKWISTMANSGLKWETTTGANIGIDYSFLNSRLNGSIEVYTNNTKNILYNVSVPMISGFSGTFINIGKIHNNGIEITLNGKILKNRNFLWDASINYSMNRDKIVSISNIDLNGDGIEDDKISDGLFIGEPLNVIYGYVNEGGMWQLADQEAGIIPQGFYPGTYKVKDLDGDGVITVTGDRKILGYMDPAYRISFMNSLKYRNLAFKFIINGIQGGKNYYYSAKNDPQTMWGAEGDTYDNFNKVNWDYWLPENPNAKYRRPDAPSLFGQPLLTQRNFYRLQNISLSYTINSAILKKYYINNLEVFLNGKNLITWAPQWDGLDPETGDGFDTLASPVLKNYSIGLRIEF